MIFTTGPGRAEPEAVRGTTACPEINGLSRLATPRQQSLRRLATRGACPAMHSYCPIAKLCMPLDERLFKPLIFS